MITVVKLDPRGVEKLRYPARVTTRLDDGVVLEAHWTRPTLDLGYTTFEPGDHFVEYFYTNRWFHIFAISAASGQRKGWYCNIAAPAIIGSERVEQIDLLLDVWVNACGQALILDEEEFTADTTLTTEQRDGAQQGLQDLLTLIKEQCSPFSF